MLGYAFDKYAAACSSYYILDPGAGTGPWGEMARKLLPCTRVDAYEIDPAHPPNPAYDAWHTTDFLTAKPCPHLKYDFVIGNPPYRDAEAFVRKSFEFVSRHGIIVFLLKLAFLEGQRRRDGLYSEYPLAECVVLSKRPSFQADGKTTPDAYGVFIWQMDHSGPTTIKHL